MIQRYGDANWQNLYIPKNPGFIPRRSRFGDASNILMPLGSYDTIQPIAWDELKDVIEAAHKNKTMPMYHQNDTWAKEGFRYNQNGIGYCWTWGGTAGVADCRAAEGKDTVLLAPVSMGYLVGWKDRGNYLESYIEGVQKTGVASADYVDGDINSHNRNPNSYKDDWEEDRKQYRLDQVWDTDARNGDRTMILHCATILAKTARPLYIAYNWWGHALECVGMNWDESKQNNVEWIIRNSHNEPDFISLDGSRGVPDEAYGFVSTVLA